MIKLISLCQEPGGLWYIDFSDYEEKGGRLEWTGKSEECRITEAELYALIKPKLVASQK